MPGINLLVSTNKITDNLSLRFSNTQSNMRHYPNYISQILFETNNVMLGCTRYNEYPVRYSEHENFFAVVEGMLYNVSQKELDLFISNLVSQKAHIGIVRNQVEEFLLNADGEFVILIYDKSKETVVILNDALGRLPLYYYKDNEYFILSREVKFITHFMHKVALDRLAVAEYLLFMYPLGHRTLLEHVKRLEPAVKIEYVVYSGSLHIQNMHIWNLEKKFSKNRTIEECTGGLVKLFREATRSRVESMPAFKNLVSLSGGLDSRAVFAVLSDIDSKLTAVTYLDHEGTAQNDVTVARELVHKLGVNWELIELEKRNFEDMRNLIDLKDGLNFAAMGYILDFLTKLKTRFGTKVVFYTGDGGDKVLPQLKPSKLIRSIDELVDVIIQNCGNVFEARRVENFVSMNQIKEEIKSILMSYPENDLNQKYVHFVVFERGYKWLFEGEDRNRFYFWSTSPFWSSTLFDYAMKIPDDYKDYRKLQLDFLKKISKNCMSVKYPNWGVLGELFGDPLSSYILPRIETVILKYPFLLKSARRMIYRAQGIYNPNEMIANYERMPALLSLNQFDFPFNLKELLGDDLDEPAFFTLISLLMYASNVMRTSSAGCQK